MILEFDSFDIVVIDERIVMNRESIQQGGYMNGDGELWEIAYEGEADGTGFGEYNSGAGVIEIYDEYFIGTAWELIYSKS